MKVNPKPDTEMTKPEVTEFFLRVLRDMSHAENIDQTSYMLPVYVALDNPIKKPVVSTGW